MRYSSHILEIIFGKRVIFINRLAKQCLANLEILDFMLMGKVSKLLSDMIEKNVVTMIIVR